MKTKLIAAVLVAVSAAVAAPAFASGYGPAPFYHPADGAPASQRGQSSQTVASEQNAVASAATESFGGVADGASQSGARHVTSVANNVYKAH